MSMASSPSPEEYAQQASCFCANLNGLVDRDTSRLFRGNRARVYRGTLKREGSGASGVIQVALKTVWFAPEGDGSVEYVLREVHVWSKLCHPNIAKLLGFATEFDVTLSMVSEWMVKGNAYQYVQDQSVDPRPLLLDIAKGLAYLHTRESGAIYHGNLKGFNVLISNDGHALLAGFGSTRFLNSSFDISFPADHIGSLYHSPPESFSNENYKLSAAGDIWSFGMTALELFTRPPPFHKMRTVQTLSLPILRGPPDRPSGDETCFRLSDEWWNICLSCWQTDPSSRPSASDIIEKINTIPSHSNVRKLISLDEINPCDVVILVFGTTGSGMSNFTNKLTGMATESEASKLGSCTEDLEVFRCERDGKRFVFVDTPGFDSSQSQIVKISRMLKTIYRRDIKLTGVIYTHRILDAERCLGLFATLYGGEEARRVRLVTTMWDEADMESAKEIENTLKAGQWKSLLDAGARYERFHNTHESAWEIVLGLGDNTKALLLQRELVDMKMEFTQTTTGEQLLLGVTSNSPSFPGKPRSPIHESEIKPTDIVILVLGTTGSGMSNFINKLTGMQAEIGTDSLESCTTEVNAYACDRGGKRFIFVDTPGFNSTLQTDTAVLTRILHWLRTTYQKCIEVTGIIYTYRINDIHGCDTELTSLRIVAALCGAEAADRMRLVTTMWDDADEEIAKSTEVRLKDDVWQLLLSAGACYQRFNNDEGSAWVIVLGLGDTKKALVLQREVVDMEMKLEETSAGRRLLQGITQPRPSFPNYPREAIQVSNIRPNDIVILVLGTTGSGMSNFINTLTGMPPENKADKLGSCTKDVNAYAHGRDGKRFIFVDTPGFNSSQSQLQVLKKIAVWLATTWRSSIKLAGIIYTCRIIDAQIFHAELTNLGIFAVLCGAQVARQVRLVTTMWDEIDVASAENTENAIKSGPWKSFLDAGSRCERFDNSRDSAWRIVLGLDDQRKALLSQRDHVDGGMDFTQTCYGSSNTGQHSPTTQGQQYQWIL